MYLYHVMICYEIIPPAILYFRTTKNCVGNSQGLQKNPSGHSLCVNFVKRGEEALCLCATYQGAGVDFKFLQVSPLWILCF